jgi:hypothetical protein
VHSFMSYTLYRVGVWVASRACRFIPGERAPGYYLNRWLVGPQSRRGHFEEEIQILPLLEMEGPSSVVQPVA